MLYNTNTMHVSTCGQIISPFLKDERISQLFNHTLVHVFSDVSSAIVA